MRELPVLLQEAGLGLHLLLQHVLAQAGEASFFSSMIESYVPMAVNAGVLQSAEAESWLVAQREASTNGTFFGSCNFYWYIATKR